VFKVSNVSHITYATLDMEKSLDFLVNMMGFFRQQRGTTTYVGIGDVLFELSKRNQLPVDPDRPDAYLLGLVVDDLDATIAELTAKGVAVTRPIWKARTFYGKQAVVQDPGGPQLALREYREPDGPHYMDWKPEE
jgi:predicted enzyme related to lactoylglutathione lyase